MLINSLMIYALFLILSFNRSTLSLTSQYIYLKGKGWKGGMSIFRDLRFIAYFVGGDWESRTFESQRVIEFKYLHTVTLKFWYIG